MLKPPPVLLKLLPMLTTTPPLTLLPKPRKPKPRPS